MHKIYGAFLSLALFIYTGNAVADPISDLGKCVDGGSTVSECYQSEARRYVAKIQEIYDTYAKDEFFNDFKVDRAVSNTEKFRRIMNTEYACFRVMNPMLHNSGMSLGE